MAKPKIVYGNLEEQIRKDGQDLLIEAGIANGTYSTQDFLAKLDNVSLDKTWPKRKRGKINNLKNDIKKIADAGETVTIKDFYTEEEVAIEKITQKRIRKIRKFTRPFIRFVMIPFITYIFSIGTLDFISDYHSRKSTKYRVEAYTAQFYREDEEAGKYQKLSNIESKKSEEWKKWSKKIDILGLLSY